MPMYCLILFFTWILVSLSWVLSVDSCSWCLDDYLRQSNREFEQKTDRFWEFHEESNTWVEVKLPYDLISCVDDNCSKVGMIDQSRKNMEQVVEPQQKENLEEESSDVVLPVRKRISLTKMSETSVWITGESGCIYERFWNGLQWVIAPHDLPLSAGQAISVFIVNQTILALSEAGVLYQMELNENSQPVWGELIPVLDQRTIKEAEQSSIKQIKSGVVSLDRRRVFFCTKNGSLLELNEIEPPRWIDHGRPPGANVAAIADAETIRAEVLYIISSAGDLYEYDSNSKPSWKKHIGREGLAYDASLIPTTGSTLRGLSGDHSTSLFLLSKGGNLVERRLHGRKWKWIFHGCPKGHHLSSITSVSQDELNGIIFSLLLTTSVGSVFEYRNIQVLLKKLKILRHGSTISIHHMQKLRGLSLGYNIRSEGLFSLWMMVELLNYISQD
ncbi:hypothetical protein HS088_TW23G00187 [Tripterygium wilfordii]|uniref:Uncharacterized protein n=1 Tax=Tripterygium wilfordii TaxID=458696 RepID=A0A7J7BUW3_TRIWF|nr:hypothetical protein HS088_TW23G00187 [Tripterygium wilfordii]